MSRVHCIECGIAVVVDPSGLCPDGHQVGANGARIDQAMGSQAPHPQEPEPWVAAVDVGSVPTAASEPRAIRPVAAPASPAADTEDEVDSDALLQELHALSDLDFGAAPVPVAVPPSAPTAPPVPAAVTPAPSEPRESAPRETAPLPAPEAHDAHDAHEPAGRTGAAAEAFAELTALEAAVQTLQAGVDERGADEPRLEAPARTAGHLSVVDDMADLEDMFAMSEAEARPAPAPVAAPVAAPMPSPATFPAPTTVPAPATFPAPAAQHDDPTQGATEQSSADHGATAHSLDLGNFTARGDKVAAGGGRRRLFGR